MIFIFGFRSRGAVLAIVTLACRNGHVAAHRIARITRWFTLFFVPVIPFSRKYRSICIQCGLTLDIPKDDAEAFAARASAGDSAPLDPVAPPLPAAAAESVLPPAGWYPDPAGSHGQRYWDGRTWTESVEHF